MSKRADFGFWQSPMRPRRPDRPKPVAAPRPRPYGDPGDLSVLESTTTARMAAANRRRAKALLAGSVARLPLPDRLILRKIAADFAGKRQVHRDRKRLDTIEAGLSKAEAIEITS
jgi:hypothetical protein